MRASRVASFGPPSVIVEQQDVPIPVPSPTQVLIRVKAAGINPVETYIRSGQFPGLPDLPYTPGTDCSGVVESVGSSVTKFKPGDKVWTHESISGSYAELSAANENAVFALPEELDFEQGAALGIPYLTAYRALVHKANVQSGETVVVNGASGGAGIASIQVAKGLGCKTIGTAGTAEGLALIKEAGADEAYDYHTPNFLQVISEANNGIDVVLEMAAHANLGNDMAAMAKGGRICVIGSRGTVEVDPITLVLNESKIMGIYVFDATTDQVAETAEGIAKGSKEGWVRPVIGKKFTLAQASDAHEDIMNSKGAQGRTILTLD